MVVDLVQRPVVSVWLVGVAPARDAPLAMLRPLPAHWEIPATAAENERTHILPVYHTRNVDKVSQCDEVHSLITKFIASYGRRRQDDYILPL